jgi:hypothetical protein
MSAFKIEDLCTSQPCILHAPPTHRTHQFNLQSTEIANVCKSITVGVPKLQANLYICFYRNWCGGTGGLEGKLDLPPLDYQSFTAHPIKGSLLLDCRWAGSAGNRVRLELQNVTALTVATSGGIDLVSLPWVLGC